MFKSNRRPAATLRPMSSSLYSYKPSSLNGVKKPPKCKPRTPKPVAGPATRPPPPPPCTRPVPLQASYLFDSYHGGDDIKCELDGEFEDDGEYEDDIIVNSVELGPSMRSMGVAHYLEQVAKFDPDDFTPMASPNCRISKSSSSSFTVWPDSGSGSGDEDEARGFEIKHPQGSRWGDKGINYYNSDMPMPPASVAEYQREIYKTKTTDPAVYLAIIRIAEKNMPAINFSSAVNHLPNLHPKDPIPKLKRGIMNSQRKERRSDIAMNVIFLPHFYHDGRHALGYYALSPEPDNWTWAANQAGLFVKHELFTPCTSWDLEQYDLVEYVKGLDGTYSTDGEGLDAEYIDSVGARGGKWLAWDVVEDWEYWLAELQVVRGVWERDLALTRGIEETHMSEVGRRFALAS
ncbi:hypothetical protein PTMSG1_01571 [Pyrenophora teres f. maculata]|nr:hypothetical protein PTMSG1_01571 [Pyrenophora teres f. maculata]